MREKSKSLIFKINREVEVVEMKGLGFLRAVDLYGLGEVFKMRGFGLSKDQGAFLIKVLIFNIRSHFFTIKIRDSLLSHFFDQVILFEYRRRILITIFFLFFGAPFFISFDQGLNFLLKIKLKINFFHFSRSHFLIFCAQALLSVLGPLF